MRKGENLAKHTSSKDSITMNLEKSAASFSKSDSERFRLDFLFKDTIYAVYFSLALHSFTHHGVQYTQVDDRLMSRCQFQVLSTGEIPILNTIGPQPQPSST